MKLLAVIVAALALAGAAQAEPPEGFRESPALSVRAAKIAAVDGVVVYCATTVDDWRRRVAETGRRTQTALGMARIAEGEMLLAPVICSRLHRRLDGRPVGTLHLAVAIYVVTHEAMHLRGEADERTADCLALRRLAFAARTFGVMSGTRIRALRRALTGRTLCS